ncbi:hypothetical protein D3C83_192490 [compost metagenome]
MVCSAVAAMSVRFCTRKSSGSPGRRRWRCRSRSVICFCATRDAAGLVEETMTVSIQSTVELRIFFITVV